MVWATLRKSFLSAGVGLLSPLFLSKSWIYLLISAELFQSYVTENKTKNGYFAFARFPHCRSHACSAKYLALSPATSKCPPSKTSLPTWKIRYLENPAKAFVVPGELPSLCLHQALPGRAPNPLLQEAAWAASGWELLLFAAHPGGTHKYTPAQKGSFNPRWPNQEVRERPLLT